MIFYDTKPKCPQKSHDTGLSSSALFLSTTGSTDLKDQSQVNCEKRQEIRRINYFQINRRYDGIYRKGQKNALCHA